MKTVTLIVVGAGARGQIYADYALALPEEARIVGVAEPLQSRRTDMASKHHIPPKAAAADWRELARRRRFADGVIIATQDALHAEPAIAFARKGYHILIEKPMAPNAPDCRRIAKAALANDIVFAVGHVMRYSHTSAALRSLIDSGAIGRIVSVQHVEPAGYWRYAHSYVRGPWSREENSSPMLLAKSCHDIDWLRFLIGARCRSVSSFGGLMHFRREDAPAGAGERCLDCAIEPGCCYSAKRLYLTPEGATRMRSRLGHLIDGDPRPEAVLEALRTGPYGRCVYACDNDVVDHQVVNLLYDNGVTATFTMNPFNAGDGRKTRIFGTKGEIDCDDRHIEVYDFLTDRRRTLEPPTGETGILPRHDGGDFGLMRGFVTAVAAGDPSKVLSGAAETLETHLTVFAAEMARHTGRVVSMQQAGASRRLVRT